jgi:bacteriophage N4 adsorption protein B
LNPITLSYDLADIVGYAIVAVAILFAFFRTDDMIFDAMYWWTFFVHLHATWRGNTTIEELHGLPQQRIAIFVAAWHEEDVIDQMLEYAAANIDYDHYDILVGVYPNDDATRSKVEAASQRYPNVHAVINDKPGPTTKAQNLNCVYRAMLAIEDDDPFAIVVLHDVEDVIHPLSLRLYNRFVPESQLLQIPVFALEYPWYEFVGWTYADEFAKNHCKDMLLRERLGAFVPSAGVGTAMARSGLDRVAESERDLFPEGALTEDYQFALRLHRHGLRTSFTLLRLSPQHKGEPKTAAAYIATREYFPNKASAAIRQKSRWVAGICLQAWQKTGWHGNFATRYMLYRDRRGLIGNMGAFIGYVVFAVSLALVIWNRFDARIFTPILPNVRWVWLLLEFVLLTTLLELIQGACFTTWIYGREAGLLSVLRAPVAAYINGRATFRALRTFFGSLIRNKPMQWAKTAHVFPTKTTLETFTREATTP